MRVAGIDVIFWSQDNLHLIIFRITDEVFSNYKNCQVNNPINSSWSNMKVPLIELFNFNACIVHILTTDIVNNNIEMLGIDIGRDSVFENASRRDSWLG